MTGVASSKTETLEMPKLTWASKIHLAWSVLTVRQPSLKFYGV